MFNWKRMVLVTIGIDLLIVCAVQFHLGGKISSFSQLFGASVGAGITFFSVLKEDRAHSTHEPWMKFERLSWLFIGLGQMMWAIGEGFWRYYLSIGQQPFPSLADIGYSCFPVFCFIGLMLQPRGMQGKRLLVVLDSFIATASLLAISWYLLLGRIAQSPDLTGLAKFLGLYYPMADAALLSCVAFLLIRGQEETYQATARKTSLLLIVLGLCVFATSDFIFNIQQSNQAYVEGTWVDMGWPLGMLTIGLAAYLRSSLPKSLAETVLERVQNQSKYLGFGIAQLIPYVLIILLFLVLTLNITSTNALQVQIRFVLLLATIAVIGLVITRQLLTLRENEHLSRLQALALRKLEEQSRHITDRNVELEQGISHLKAVQTSLANGNLRARAHLNEGIFWTLSISLNLLAERLSSLGQSRAQMEHLKRALVDLSSAIEQYRLGYEFLLPPSCKGLPEIIPILQALRLPYQAVQQSPEGLATPRPQNSSTPKPSESPTTSRPQGASIPKLSEGLTTPRPQNNSIQESSARLMSPRWRKNSTQRSSEKSEVPRWQNNPVRPTPQMTPIDPKHGT